MELEIIVWDGWVRDCGADHPDLLGFYMGVFLWDKQLYLNTLFTVHTHRLKINFIPVGVFEIWPLQWRTFKQEKKGVKSILPQNPRMFYYLNFKVFYKQKYVMFIINI